jgi:hypothetical protein
LFLATAWYWDFSQRRNDATFPRSLMPSDARYVPSTSRFAIVLRSAHVILALRRRVVAFTLWNMSSAIPQGDTNLRGCALRAINEPLCGC